MGSVCSRPCGVCVARFTSEKSMRSGRAPASGSRLRRRLVQSWLAHLLARHSILPISSSSLFLFSRTRQTSLSFPNSTSPETVNGRDAAMCCRDAGSAPPPLSESQGGSGTARHRPQIGIQSLLTMP